VKTRLARLSDGDEKPIVRTSTALTALLLTGFGCADLIGADFEVTGRKPAGSAGESSLGGGASGEGSAGDAFEPAGQAGRLGNGGVTFGGAGHAGGAGRAGAIGGGSGNDDSAGGTGLLNQGGSAGRAVGGASFAGSTGTAGNNSVMSGGRTGAGGEDAGEAGAAGQGGMGGDGGVGGSAGEWNLPTGGAPAGAGGTSSGTGGEVSVGGASAGIGGTPGGAGDASAGAGGLAGGGAAGAGGTWACGEPTPTLDPDGDLLNDACDPDMDEDGVLNTSDSAPRDPRIPPFSPGDIRSGAPGIVMADACVRQALTLAGEELALASLAPEFPLVREHTHPELGEYYLRPWGLPQGGYYVAGPDASPGALLDGAELKLPRAADRTSYFEYSFDELGARGYADDFKKALFLRGNATSWTLFRRAGFTVTIFAGSYASGNLTDVFTLTVNVGTIQNPGGTYPNTSCPTSGASLGRWQLSYAPLWESVAPDDLTYMCLEGGAAYAPGEDWTSGSLACECKAVFDVPGQRATLTCTE
jgi:hypothetical protein